MQNQTTLKQEITFQGKALFTGHDVTIRLCPADPETGVIFRRVDLPGSPDIPAKTEYVQEGIRTTKIGVSGASVQTIEHLMAAAFAYKVDNLIVEISGPEVPIFDGSALPFVEWIEKTGIVEQNCPKEVYVLEAPCYFSAGETHLIALPSDEFKISYTLHYPTSPYLKSQYFSFVMTPSRFRQEIAPCRTFALHEEILPLIQKGILKNGGLEHGVVIDGERVLNPEGVRFFDEMVRHKILDLIGDIALLGHPLNVHLIGIKTGHTANHAIVKEMRKFLRRQ